MSKNGQEMLTSRRERVVTFRKALTPAPVLVVPHFGADRPLTSLRIFESSGAVASVNVWMVPAGQALTNADKLLPTTALPADVGYAEVAPIDGAIVQLKRGYEIWASAPSGDANIYVNVYAEDVKQRIV